MCYGPAHVKRPTAMEKKVLAKLITWHSSNARVRLIRLDHGVTLLQLAFSKERDPNLSQEYFKTRKIKLHV